MAEFEFKMTLLANGSPSGTARVRVTVPNVTSIHEIPPSGNYPFTNAAWTWRLQVCRATVVGNFVHGYMTVCDANNCPVMVDVPFVAYIGGNWPQAPVGVVHCTKPSEWDNGYFVFSVLIEKA